jgi:hypothetical protein
LERVAWGLTQSLDEVPQMVEHLRRVAARSREQAVLVVALSGGSLAGRQVALHLGAAARACEEAADLASLAAPKARAWVERAVGGASPHRLLPESSTGTSARAIPRAVVDLTATTGPVELDNTEAIAQASEAASLAAAAVESFTIKSIHVEGGPSRKAKFLSALDVRQAIKDTLCSTEARFMSNEQLPETFRVVTDLRRVVGTRGETSLRVIVSNDGRIINAFPVRNQ